MFSVTENGAFRKRSPGWRNLKTPARWCSVDGRKKSFSKTLTSNGHVISVTVPFRPVPVDAFHCFGGLTIHRTRLTTIPPHHLSMKSSLGSFFVGLLLLSTRFRHVRHLLCFPQKITTQEGGNRERC